VIKEYSAAPLRIALHMQQEYEQCCLSDIKRNGLQGNARELLNDEGVVCKSNILTHKRQRQPTDYVALSMKVSTVVQFDLLLICSIFLLSFVFELLIDVWITRGR
jgi:hypothetical protein